MEYENLLEFCQTDRQREVVQAVIDCGGKLPAAKKLDIDIRAIQRTFKRIQRNAGINDAENKKEGDKFDITKKINDLAEDYHTFVAQDRFNIIVTSAQNGTPVHSKFFENLKVLSSKINAKLLVIPFRYKNPTSVFKEHDKTGWSPELFEYMCEDDFELNENISILGALKTQPTATRPLSGLEQVSGGSSAIIGHTKLELKSVATPSNRLPKILVSTGCCTVSNYTDSKAGYKGEKRHSLSAIVVEVSGKKFFMRQVIADESGNFIDMLTEYNDGKTIKAPQASVLSTGDLHGVNSDPDAVAATFTSKGSMLNYFKPRYVTLDDTLDFERSHHIKKDPVQMAQLINSGHTVEGELKATFSIIDSFDSPYTQKIIKRSNHDEHFERWVKETDPRQDPLNYKIWCESYPLMIDNIDIYEHFASKWMKSFGDAVFLKRDESFVVDGVAHDGHGDLGANGSRGNLLGFTKLGCPAQWGHSHFCGIMDDQYQNGTLSKLRMKYNRGASSWIHANTIQYGNGKRSLLFIIDGKWRFDDE